MSPRLLPFLLVGASPFLVYAIYDPNIPTPPPKVKQRLDFSKFSDGLDDHRTTTRRPVWVYNRRRPPEGSQEESHSIDPRVPGDPARANGRVIHGNTAHIRRTTSQPSRNYAKSGKEDATPHQTTPGRLLCPEPNGLFPYPLDCSKFVNCAFGRPHLQSCAPGTLFNENILACDWPYNVRCNPGERQTPQVTPPTPPPQRNAATGTRASSSTSDSDSGNASSSGSPSKGLLGSIFGSVSETAENAANSFGGLINTHVNPIIDEVKDQVDWTLERTKDKGKRLLNRIGVSESETLCLRQDGVFPYPKDCGKFVNCHRGRPHLQRCAPGTLFNSLKGICDFPHHVVCPTRRAPPSSPSPSIVIPPRTPQTVRLRGSGVPWAGYVQVQIGGNWMLVTDFRELWTRDEANVVCRSLGYSRGAESASQGRDYGLLPGVDVGVKKVECEGEEEDIFECNLLKGQQEDIQNSVVGVRCVTNWVSECTKGGVRWGNKCYHVHTDSTVSHAIARGMCAQDGARLVTISSKEENNFVSELLGSTSGDGVGFHTGGVRTRVFGDVFWLWQNSSIPPAHSLQVSVWWPGWNSTNSTQNFQEQHQSVWSPPTEAATSSLPSTDGDDIGSDTHCIVLRDNFKVTYDDNAPSRDVTSPVEYFFWTLEDCSQNLHYICETPKREIGCVDGRGEGYRGSANITRGGEVCLQWSQPDLHHKVRRFAGATDLRHNHCANPDGDDHPWCFTQHGTIDFCDIPRCEAKEEEKLVEEVPEEAVPEEEVLVEEIVNACGTDKFACTSGGTCIHQEWLCDGQKDCDDGSDEQDCHDYSEEFSKRVNQRMSGREVEKWLYTIKTACAARCVLAKNFLCLSFNYLQRNETCILSDSTVARSGGLETAGGWEYYEMKSKSVNCSELFQCQDGKCLNTTQRCDGRRDCVQGEDESDCEGQVNFQVRLVNGSDSHEGRVEVRAWGRWGVVCDDMWGVAEGDVVCQQLGFPLGAKEVFPDSKFGSGEGRFLMDDLNCRGNEDSLADCDFAGWGEHDCQPGEAAGLTCYQDGDTCGRDQWRCGDGRCIALRYLCDKVDDCRDASDEDRNMCQAEVEVRLVDAQGNEVLPPEEGDEEVASVAGRVEVRYLGLWGTVCDDDFALEEGHVLCRMMGWAGASYIYKNSSFGPGSGQIWLDDLRCLGYEKTVTDCHHLPWGENNCDHSEDVGLQCSNNPEFSEEENTLTDTAPLATPDLTSLPPTCGRRAIEDDPSSPRLEQPKIISGHTPPRGAHPWMVAIQLRTTLGPSQWCGGAILGEEYILTAAHCLYKYPASTYIIKVGDYNAHDIEEEEQEFRVASLVIHPRYDKGPFLNNDIALLKIKRKRGNTIRFGQYVQPVCLVPPSWTYPDYLNCTVAGWGSLAATKGHSKVLQSTLLPILPQRICEADHVYGPTRLTDGMYCAGYLEGGIDTCQGDSGGPMVCLVDGRHTVVGITSWGHGCARPNKPGVYTKLTHYLPWLYEHLG